MKQKDQLGCGAVSIPALFIVFLVLKMTGVLDWSWWWVTSPLWISAIFVLFAVVLAIIVLYIME